MLRRAQPARLLALEHRAPNTRLALLERGETAIGSADGSAVRITDGDIAPQQAVISYRRGRYYVCALRSASGDYLNNRRVRHRHVLAHDDRLRFGATAEYRFIDPDAAMRRRHRRGLQASIILLVIAAGGVVHGERWDGGVLSVATASRLFASAQSSATSIVADVSSPQSGADAAAAPPTAVDRVPAANVSTSKTTDPIVAKTRGNAPQPSISSTLSSPTASSSPAASVVWLTRLNHFRAMTQLGLLQEDPAISAAAQAHSEYLVANYADRISDGESLGDAGHEESRGEKGYSPAGAAIAPNAQLAWGCGPYESNGQIDQWIAGPFHRLPMLDPFLIQVGFGEAADNGCWVAALRLAAPDEHPARYAKAIEFPPDGVPVPINWSGIEFPSPLASCPGYEMPVGLPITLQLGRFCDAQLTAHSLSVDGAVIDSCAFDARGYRNPDAGAQEYGRWEMRSSGAVVLIPRAPLVPGKSYSVSITAHGRIYAWTVRGGD
jgi:pSer/pThr/pTyr-binding forkhead associated (FHA) protein